VFKSAADFIEVNNGASKALIRRLGRRGYRVFYDRIVCMASNWLIKYEDELAKQFYNVAIAKTEHMCQEVLAGVERTLRIHPVLQAATTLVHMGESWGARFFGKELHVSAVCIDCGTCVEQCPTGNIRRERERITFGWDCVSCMRCIYACPQGAIAPRFSKFCVLKGGYDIQSIIHDPAIEGNYIDEDTRGFYRHFCRYVQDVTL
jgi:ferredoxin